MKPTTSMFLSGFFLGIAVGIFVMSMTYKFSNSLKQECIPPVPPAVERPAKQGILAIPIDHVA